MKEVIEGTRAVQRDIEEVKGGKEAVKGGIEEVKEI